MDLLDHPHAQGHFAEATQSVVHGVDVVDHFADVLGQVRSIVRLKLEHVFQGALGPFDLRTQDGFLSHEQIRVWEDRGHAIKPAEGPVGLRQEVDRFAVQVERRVWWKWVRDECPISLDLANELPNSYVDACSLPLFSKSIT